MSCKKLIHCIGLAIAEKGLKGLAGAVPFGAVVYDIAFNARERYLKVCVPGNELQEISFAANATPDQIKGQVAEVIEEIKKNAPPAIAGELKNPEIEQKLKSYLQQVPSAIRASMRRPSDPSGKSLSSGFSLGKGDAFVKLLPENLPKFKPGESPVGNWKLVELLGVGGFGEVWKAEHPTLKGIPPVALKFCLSPESAKFIRHEGQLLSRIMECSANNPGIVKLKQAYIDSEINCLEYEFVNGGDLCGLLADWLQLSKEKRIQVALQMLLNLARTIAPLHRMNPPIVHRDLKPANILIVKIDNKILLKVTDFGIGGFASKQHLDQNTKGFDQSNILTQTLRGSHTPLYASPEQQKGETPHPTDDVHALGVIGLQLLLCDLTIGPTGDWDVELKELGVNEKLIEILKTCLARQSRRFQDASILASELQKLINEKPEGSVSKIIPKQETLKTEEKLQSTETNNDVWQNISKQKKGPTKPSNLITKKSYFITVSLIILLIGLFALIQFTIKSRTEIKISENKILNKTQTNKEDFKNQPIQQNRSKTNSQEKFESGKKSEIKIQPISQNEMPEIKDLGNNVKLEMVLIPAGKFIMGSPNTELGRNDDEKQHEVKITKPFYLGKYEVTQEQWETIMGYNPSEKKGANLIKNLVSWNDCQVFIKKLNEKTGESYRLPTEAEWEYACRGGTTTAFYVGDQITKQDGNLDNPKAYVKPAGTYKPNPFGLYDMHGNVWEWCNDWYGEYPSNAVEDPKGPSLGTKRVMRGGSFFDILRARSACRFSDPPNLGYHVVGFRLAKTK